MPPKTRGTKAAKALKENECVLKTKTLKSVNNTKPLRKALADKTNSASDDNTSMLIENTKTSPLTKSKSQCDDNNIRPRRNKKLPSRYNELTKPAKLSNRKDSPSTPKIVTKSAKIMTSGAVKKPIVVLTPLKSPVCDLDNSLLKSRPKRICKLPSKFDDHSISPNKFIPVQPINASTPLANKTKTVNKENIKKSQNARTKIKPISGFQKPSQSPGILSTQSTIKRYFSKTSSDTNNNAKQKQKTKPSLKKSPVLNNNRSILSKDVSEKRKETSLKRDSSKVDVYEFTYDPNEEPPPAKKKRKKTVKRPTKPKTVNVKSNYDKNLAKALAALKRTVATKSSPPPKVLDSKPVQSKPVVTEKTMQSNPANFIQIQNTNINESIIPERNYNSIRVEDIAMDMQADDDYIDYSPVNSPYRLKTPVNQSIEKLPVPSNIQDLSFFDEQPAASSSMNASVRHPLASPWRVEFGSLPIKWQANTYVKPNMTPALESSYINDSRKKHVYTNIVPEADESLPQIVESPNLKQTSIISFIKEVVERSANKKKKIKATPVKANSLFEDTNTTIVTENSPNKENDKCDLNTTPTKRVSLENNSNNTSSGTDNENVQNNSSDQNDKSGENNTYFGFDDTEDQENISPKKKKVRSLRARTRGVLRELNQQKGPMRAVIPVIAKSKPINNSEGVNKLFGEIKSATEPPVFPEAAVSTEITVAEPTLPDAAENDDGQSVHLFEDVDVVHYQKPIRKSYGKPKRVAFRKNSMDSDTSQTSDVDQPSSDENLDDLSFKLPTEKPKKVIKKKQTKKQKLSKKEEKEVEAWAAGFNSMCEDIEEFDLVVE